MARPSVEMVSSIIASPSLPSLPLPQLVLMLNGIPPDFQKFPILIKASEAEKNFLAKQEGEGAGVAGPRRRRAAG